MDDADAKSALSWIRGFKRGVTNDPPDTCPDLPFDPNHRGDYSSGMRVGEAIREKTKIDHSSTLIIKGFPDGLVIQFAPQKIGVTVDWTLIRSFATPAQIAIGSGQWEVHVGDKKTFIDCEINDVVTLSPGTDGNDFILEELHFVHPFVGATGPT